MPLEAYIEGNTAKTMAVSAVAASTGALQRGIYDVNCDVDVFIMIGTNVAGVTTANGYKIFAGVTVPFAVDDGRSIGAIAGGAGTLRYHKAG